jgi:hypothetical protein
MSALKIRKLAQQNRKTNKATRGDGSINSFAATEK